jgi:pimeloyl-ACP methyl ester carboxylesterase
MEPPTRRTLTIHGHELSYLDSGTGSVVLFIHGILGSQRQWTHLIDRLHDDHRVIVPDLFGHGESDKPVGDYSLGAHAATLRDLLDRLGIERVTLVGHSLGGGIAMEFYYLFPERVERLVLVASGGLGREVNPVLRSATLPGAAWVLPILASGWVRARAEGAGRALSRAGWRGPARTSPRSGRASPRSGMRRAGAPSWPRPALSSTPGARLSAPTTTCPTPRRSRHSSSGAPGTG